MRALERHRTATSNSRWIRPPRVQHPDQLLATERASGRFGGLAHSGRVEEERSPLAGGDARPPLVGT